MKNLKMFAIAVMAFAVMAMGVRAEVATTCKEGAVASNGEACYTTLVGDDNSAIAKLDKGETIKLLKDITGVTAIAIDDDDVTIDLNGHTITFNSNAGITVNQGKKLTLTGSGEVKSSVNSTAALITVAKGSNLVVSGSVKLTQDAVDSYVSYANAPVIMISENTDSNLETFVEVGANVTVKSDRYGLVVNGTSSLKTNVKLDGNWTTGGYTVKVNGTVAYTESNAPKIDIVGGTYTSTNGVTLYAAGYAVWTVKADAVKGPRAVEVKSGDVTLAGGKFENTDTERTYGSGSKDGANAVVAVVGEKDNNYQDPDYIDLKINGGEFNAKAKGTYAILIEEAVESKLAIAGGEFAGAKDEKGKQLPVINLIGNTGVDFLNKHEGMIINGEFTGSIIGDVEGTTSDADAAAAAAALAPNAKTENGKVVVGAGANTPSDEGQQPGSTEPGETGDGNQGPTDNVKNPETNDNILVYAGLGLVSLASVAFTAKKRED